jgi:hypothetical protein
MRDTHKREKRFELQESQNRFCEREKEIRTFFLLALLTHPIENEFIDVGNDKTY